MNRSNVSTNETSCRGLAGFTLIELLTVIAIIGILASILIPVVAQVRESARRSKCQSHMRQAGLAIFAYESENGVLPGPSFRRVRRPYVTDSQDLREINWRLASYVGADKSEVWDCPTNGMVFDSFLNPGSVTFLLNNSLNSPNPYRMFGYPGGGASTPDEPAENSGNPKSLTQLVSAKSSGRGRLYTEPSQIWMISDVDGLNYNAASVGGNVIGGSVPLRDDAAPCHGDGRNYIFFDGHAEYRKMDDLPP